MIEITSLNWTYETFFPFSCNFYFDFYYLFTGKCLFNNWNTFAKRISPSGKYFTGKIISIKDFSPSKQEMNLIPSYWRDSKSLPPFSKITFEITKSRKGNLKDKTEFVGLSEWRCSCYEQDFRKFQPGKEYLIVSSEKNFIEVCNSAEVSEESTGKKIKHFDNFWFRTRAKIYPF